MLYLQLKRQSTSHLSCCWGVPILDSFLLIPEAVQQYQSEWTTTKTYIKTDSRIYSGTIIERLVA